MSTPPAPTLMSTTSSNIYDYNLLVPPPSSQPPPQPHLNPILITILVFSVIIIAATFLYLLFRHLHSISTSPEQTTSLGPGHRSSTAVTPLPLFTFSAVVRNSDSDSDCAICLSKFHPLDKLRLLPLCCHAFHAVCIDTWLHANKTCPLCRSSIHPSDSNIASALRSDSAAGAGNGSFRLEIGSVRRQAGPESENAPTAYSIGSFQYIVDGESEVIVPGHHRSVSVKDESGPLGGVVDSSVAADAAGERNWLGEYVDRLSATVSYSRRFFTGSSRRSEVSEWPELDGSRVGEEISEWFRWASGV